MKANNAAPATQPTVLVLPLSSVFSSFSEQKCLNKKNWNEYWAVFTSCFSPLRTCAVTCAVTHSCRLTRKSPKFAALHPLPAALLAVHFFVLRQQEWLMIADDLGFLSLHGEPIWEGWSLSSLEFVQLVLLNVFETWFINMVLPTKAKICVHEVEWGARRKGKPDTKMLQKYYRKSSNRLGKLLSAIVIEILVSIFIRLTILLFIQKRKRDFLLSVFFLPIINY